MIKLLVKVKNNIFNYDQPLLVGIMTILIQALLSLFITIVIVPYLLIKHYRHFNLKIKHPEKHISGSFESYHEKKSNMIHTHFNNQCSCGKTNAPDDFFDIIYKTLDDISG